MAETLQQRIRHWSEQGYRVVSETPTSAQLVRPKRFNASEFIAMPLYLLEYFQQRELQVYLSVEPDGTINESGSALDKSAFRRTQERPAAQRLAIVVGGLVLFVIVVLIVQALT